MASVHARAAFWWSMAGMAFLFMAVSSFLDPAPNKAQQSQFQHKQSRQRFLKRVSGYAEWTPHDAGDFLLEHGFPGPVVFNLKRGMQKHDISGAALPTLKDHDLQTKGGIGSSRDREMLLALFHHFPVPDPGVDEDIANSDDAGGADDSTHVPSDKDWYSDADSLDWDFEDAPSFASQLLVLFRVVLFFAVVAMVVFLVLMMLCMKCLGDTFKQMGRGLHARRNVPPFRLPPRAHTPRLLRLLRARR